MAYRWIYMPIMCISFALLNISLYAAMIEGPRFKTEEDIPNRVKTAQAWAGFFTGCLQQAVVMHTARELEARQRSTGMLLMGDWACSIVVASRVLCLSKTHQHELTRIDTTSARMVFNRIFPPSDTRLTLDQRQAEFIAFYNRYRAMRTAEPPLDIEDAHLICNAYNSLLIEYVKDRHFASGYAVSAVIGPPIGYLLLQFMDSDALP